MPARIHRTRQASSEAVTHVVKASKTTGEAVGKTDEIQSLLTAMLKVLKMHMDSGPFMAELKPEDWDLDATTYASLVTRPLDLGLIERQLVEGRYCDGKQHQFLRDIRMMLTNYKLCWSDPQALIHSMAVNLEHALNDYLEGLSDEQLLGVGCTSPSIDSLIGDDSSNHSHNLRCQTAAVNPAKPLVDTNSNATTTTTTTNNNKKKKKSSKPKSIPTTECLEESLDGPCEAVTPIEASIEAVVTPDPSNAAAEKSCARKRTLKIVIAPPPTLQSDVSTVVMSPSAETNASHLSSDDSVVAIPATRNKRRKTVVEDPTYRESSPSTPNPSDELPINASPTVVEVLNPGGIADPRKQCAYCGTRTTPMWRHGPKGCDPLCNSCGVKWKRGRILKNSSVAVSQRRSTTHSIRTPIAAKPRASISSRRGFAASLLGPLSAPITNASSPFGLVDQNSAVDQSPAGPFFSKSLKLDDFEHAALLIGRCRPPLGLTYRNITNRFDTPPHSAIASNSDSESSKPPCKTTFEEKHQDFYTTPPVTADEIDVGELEPETIQSPYLRTQFLAEQIPTMPVPRLAKVLCVLGPIAGSEMKRALQLGCDAEVDIRDLDDVTWKSICSIIQ